MNLALFDFDGTITNAESFGDFMRFAATPRRLAIGSVLLAPLIAGYRLGLVSGTRVRAGVARFALQGVDERKLREAGEAFAERVIPNTVRPEAWERIAWHRERGDTVVVVSGAFDIYLEPWCRRHGLALICSRLQVRNGRMTGRYEGAQCVGEEKPKQVYLNYNHAEYQQIYAYGDTKEDFPMLRMAHHRYFRGKTSR